MADLSGQAFDGFESSYRFILEERFETDSRAYVDLAAKAIEGDVYLGCNCPTGINLEVRRCHTWLALEFMAARFPNLDVRFP